MSGSGTGIGRYDPDEAVGIRRTDVEGVEAYAVTGPPGLAVMAAALGAFGRPPDLIVSGVNAGLNTGHSIIHSGTVGAALTAHTFGARGIAISLAASDPWQWDSALPFACAAVRWVLDRRPRTMLNINVPALPHDDIRGARWAQLDEFGHFRVASVGGDGRALQLDIGDRSAPPDPRSDTALCQDGYVTITPIEPVAPGPVPDEDAAHVV